MIKNIDKIHLCKRDKVLNAIKYLEEANRERKYIDKIVIFGSAVTEHCTDDSDIDICVYTNLCCKDKSYFNVLGNFIMNLDNMSDILYFNKLSNNLKLTVIRNGVAVYDYMEGDYEHP